MNVVASSKAPPSLSGFSSIKKIKHEKNDSAASSPLNLYKVAPEMELTLDEFEVYALKRLKVLRKIEQFKMNRVPMDQAKQKLDQLLKEDLSNPVVDNASHFILRLSYCQTEELRRWFLTHECALFQHRLQHLSETQLAQSVASYAQLKPISKDAKERLREPLLQLMSPAEFLTTSFYAVPFQQALDLVSTRQCYLHAGYAYVPQAKVYTILVGKFRAGLSKYLTQMAAHASLKADNDPEKERIYPLLQTMSTCLVNNEPSAEEAGLAGNQQLNASNVDKLVGSMPLCMRELHTGMCHDKKLKHWGRLQYGLFLKGAGLSMEDALAFFQRHFTKVTGEEFQKNYAYNIRHMYGREGKRATYTAYSCNKIIMGNAPSSGDHHGCPYKHYDSEELSSVLQRLKIGNASDRASILSFKKSQQFQLACQKHFQVMHPNASSTNGLNLDNVGNHPNAWFRASVAYKELQNQAGTSTVGESAGGTTTTNTSSPSQTASNMEIET